MKSIYANGKRGRTAELLNRINFAIGCPTNVEKSKAYEVKKSEFEKSKGTV